MNVNLDLIMSVPDAVIWITHIRGPRGRKVTRPTIYGWAARYPELLPKYDGGYRLGDLLRAEARSRIATADTRRVA